MSDGTITLGRKFELLADDAIDALRLALNGVGLSEEQMQKAKLASSSLASYTRNKQTDRAWESAKYGMARDITDNPTTLEGYVRVAMPSHGILKALPGGSEKGK